MDNLGSGNLSPPFAEAVCRTDCPASLSPLEKMCIVPIHPDHPFRQPDHPFRLRQKVIGITSESVIDIASEWVIDIASEWVIDMPRNRQDEQERRATFGWGSPNPNRRSCW